VGDVLDAQMPPTEDPAPVGAIARVAETQRPIELVRSGVVVFRYRTSFLYLIRCGFLIGARMCGAPAITAS